MNLKIRLLYLVLFFPLLLQAQTLAPVRQLLQADYMKGASLSVAITEVKTGETILQHNADTELTPASVMKLITTATALEILGESFRFPTIIQYDGEIKEGVLSGNIYIKGSGDPTLGSEHFTSDRNDFSLQPDNFLPQWIEAIKQAGIHTVNGGIIADESIFDTEGISMKWVAEDLGNYYGAGSYGLSVFDNQYKLTLRSGAAGSVPTVIRTVPEMQNISFHNYLTAQQVSTDSAYIFGAPLLNDRYLYGVLPANRQQVTLRGDIPDPALYLAEYLTKGLKAAGVEVKGSATCYRILAEKGEWKRTERQNLHTTYSPALREIVAKTNEVSHNLYADALLKYLGTNYVSKPGEVISSFGKGINVVRQYWAEKGIDVASLWMHDGSGLAPTDKLTATLMNEILVYMVMKSSVSDVFVHSIPQAGVEGSVRNFLRGTALQGNARLKSGSMSRVKGYAGYTTHKGKQYAISVFVNNYNCEGRIMTRDLEQLLSKLFQGI